MSDNIVKSTDTNVKSTEKKTVAKKSATPKIAKEKNDKDLDVVVEQDGFKFIYFDSGSSYVTSNGYRFSKEQRIHQIPIGEADYLLTLDNFRLPDQLEFEEFAKENS